MAKKAAVMVELDYCVGCSQCKLACQNYYNLSVQESYMGMVLQKPEIVDGKEEMFMSPYPWRLDKCAYCLEQEGSAPCQDGCISRALHVGEVDEIEELAKKTEGNTCVFYSN